MTILARNGLLRPDQVRAGFEVEPDDHCIIVRHNGLLFQRYGQRTPAAVIHQDIDQVIETQKAVTMQPFTPEDFSKNEYGD